MNASGPSRTVIALDTETHLIRPGACAPELACLSYQTPGRDPLLVDRHEALDLFASWIADPSITLAGHNVTYDLLVLCEEARRERGLLLLPAVFAAYDDERITDTMIRQKLLDIAAGCYRGRFHGDGRFQKYNYDLGSVGRRAAGVHVDKDDPYRLRYGEFRDLPLSQWEPGALSYPLGDASATLAIFSAQEVHADPYLADQYRQARNAFWRGLMSAWGLRTNPIGVEAFALEVQGQIVELQAELVGLGLVRPDGTRDIKAAARAMAAACTAKGIAIPLTDGGAERAKAENVLGQLPPECFDATGKISKGGAAAFNQIVDAWGGTGISLDEPACKRVEDPALEKYAEFVTLRTVASRDPKKGSIGMLTAGIEMPIHTRFDIAETGRTTSSAPNVQNVRSLPGIRECFVARRGFVYVNADYPGLELHSHAQVCLDLFGESCLAETLNAGRDPHLLVAASIAHCTYEEAAAAYAVDSGWKPRKLAKVANFGFPGGLGIATFITYAAQKQYQIKLTEPEVRELKAAWRTALPEMDPYFAHVSALCEAGGGNATAVVQIRSNRIRGDARYTATCNTYFQGLGTDAAQSAGYEIARACYVLDASPLYGSRPVNFVHDEFIAETVDDSPEGVAFGGPGGTGERASAAAWEMVAIMRTAANVWLPDVPYREGEIKPVLMSHWSKKAKSKISDTGIVSVWRG